MQITACPSEWRRYGKSLMCVWVLIWLCQLWRVVSVEFYRVLSSVFCVLFLGRFNRRSRLALAKFAFQLRATCTKCRRRRRRRRRRLARNKLDELFFEPLIDITCTRSSSAADLICHCTAWQVALRWLAAAGRVRWSESASSACCLASCLRLPQGEEEGESEREIQAGSLLLAPPFWKWHQLHSKRESSAFLSLSYLLSLSLALALVIVFNSEVRSCTVSRGSSSSWSRPHATQLPVCVVCWVCVCTLCVWCCLLIIHHDRNCFLVFLLFFLSFGIFFYTYLCFAHL